MLRRSFHISRRSLRWPASTGAAVALALLLRAFVAEVDYVPSASMLPTLLPGDWILVHPLAYGIRRPFAPGWWLRWKDPVPGDVVVFGGPGGRRYVKRVAAVPGEVVEVRGDTVLVGGRARVVGPSGWLGNATGDPAGRRATKAVRVPPGKVFVLGDTRQLSQDSRLWGPVSFDRIEGKAIRVFWSTDPEVGVVRWARVGRRIR